MASLLQIRPPTTDDAADADLVARAGRDPDAFALLYRRDVGPIYRYSYRRLGSREAAEDATQQIFEKALAALPRYRDASFRGWLFTIADRTLTDRHRTEHPTHPLAAAVAVADAAPTPEELAIRAEQGRQVRGLLARLEDDERRLLELRLAGLNDAEIARLLGRNHGTVRNIQYRTVARLRTMLCIASGEKEGRNVRA